MSFEPKIQQALQSLNPVLVVDDNDDIRESLRTFLEDEGFAVATARSGMEAFACLADGLRPGLILLDLMMPEMSGWEVLEKLKNDAARAGIPVAVMSGSYRGEVPAANYVIPKPFEPDFLVRIAQVHCNGEAA